MVNTDAVVDGDKGCVVEEVGSAPRRDSKKLPSSEVALKPPDKCAMEGVGMQVKPPSSAGGGERVAVESSGNIRVEDALLGFQYCDASLRSSPLLSPESTPDCCSPNSMSGTCPGLELEPDVSTDTALAGSIGEDPTLVTAGTDVWTVCVRGCVTEWCLNSADKAGGSDFKLVDERVVGVESRVFENPDKSSLGISKCAGNGVWAVTTGVRLSADTRVTSAAVYGATTPPNIVPALSAFNPLTFDNLLVIKALDVTASCTIVWGNREATVVITV